MAEQGRIFQGGCLLAVYFFTIFAILKGAINTLAEKLKIIPLGGLDEIGKNITVLEYGKDMIVVDCGVGFPDDDMYGVDLVIPDFSYLVANQKKLRGMFITHGHEDHIGSIPYCMKQVNCPIHGTAMTNGLIKLKLEEHHLADHYSQARRRGESRMLHRGIHPCEPLHCRCRSFRH